MAKRTLVEAGYSVVEATDGSDAANKARLARVDVFVCFTAQQVDLPVVVASLQPAQLLAMVRKALA
ncbi:MAG TPA: hypothetical protein VFQ65_14595 [Kofleriaceae bacterium]|nr:hypothetical protein [Kofleriaceae bacterium]